MKFPACYGIMVGLLMVAQWTFSILADEVPEFPTAPWEFSSIAKSSARDTLHSRVNG